MSHSIEQLSRLNILLVCQTDSEGQTLLRHLQRTRAAVMHMWPAPERIGENADVVLCEYGPGLRQRLAWMPGEPRAALIVLLPQTGRLDLRELQAACPDAVLHRPYLPDAIDVALMVGLDHFNFGKRQRMRIARLDENIHAMRDIEMAKHVIMERNKVGEAEAFRMLRDMAMQRRMTVASVASKFVDSPRDLI